MSDMDDLALSLDLNPLPSRSQRIKDGTQLWRTMEGDVVRVCDMDTKHVFNSMKMMFNHLAVQWGGKPIWFTQQYHDWHAQAASGPEFTASWVMTFLRELDRRSDLPRHFEEPLALIKAQIFKRTEQPEALPEPSELHQP